MINNNKRHTMIRIDCKWRESEYYFVDPQQNICQNVLPDTKGLKTTKNSSVVVKKR